MEGGPGPARRQTDGPGAPEGGGTPGGGGVPGDPHAPQSLARWIPDTPLAPPSLVVASSDDPWVPLPTAAHWAERWGSRLDEIGAAGHINVDSGHGPWPEGLERLRALQAAAGSLPPGPLGGKPRNRRGRHGALARLRHGTRSDGRLFELRG